MLWMMGGVGLKWRDYGIIAVGVIVCWTLAVWLIHSVVTI